MAIEYRWAEGRPGRLPELAAELIRRRVNVIAATGGSPAALAAKAATAAIPIVFQIGVDPVEVGLVSSLNRPGANITGATMLASELGPKRLELLREMVPNATAIGLLVDTTSPGSSALMREVSATAEKLGLQMQIVKATSRARG